MKRGITPPDLRARGQVKPENGYKLKLDSNKIKNTKLKKINKRLIKKKQRIQEDNRNKLHSKKI
jgi:hypothetical protein